MVTASSALKLAQFSAIAALCAWSAPVLAQAAGAAGGGMGGAPSAGAGGMSAGGAGAGGESAGSGGESAGASGSGGDATGGLSGGGAGGELATGGMSGGGMGGDTSMGGMPAAAGMGGTGGAVTGNILDNGTFDTARDPWWGNASATAEPPADQLLEVREGRLCSVMMSAGKNPWDVVIGQSGVSLVKDQYYRISFSASADVERTIKFKTGLNAAPWTDYFIKTITLTTAPQTFEYTYLNLRDDVDSQFQFQVGKTAGTVCIDDIIVEPVTAPTVPPYQTPAASGHPFKYYKDFIKMGTAVDTPIFLSNPQHNAIVAGEFSMITPANSMKMNLIQPVQGMFDFTDTDGLVAWAKANNIEFRGHPLVWHTQAPAWLNDTMFSRDEMIAIMYAHIDALMTRYKGQFPYWDVVNEAIEATNGVFGFRSTVWHDRIGPDFIDLAFTRARMMDPDAKLLYNDYNSEQMGNAKGDRVFELVRDMKMRGTPIDAVGLQGHFFVEPNGSTATGLPNMQAIADNMARYAEIGVDVHITESDFRIGKPNDPAKTEIQNKFYADLLQVCIDAPNCKHFTVWGLSDLDSWVPSTFTEYDFAHVWDATLKPKPAYAAMSAILAKYNADGTLIGGSAGAGGAAGSAGAPATPAAPAAASDDSGGCSFAPNARGTAPWLLTALAALGVWASRRRSKRQS